MTQIIRRHWAMGVLIMIVAIFALLWMFIPLQREAAAQENSRTEQLDAVTFGRIDALRRHLCLGNEDLAALGCTQAQAEQILTALLTWYRSQAVTLEQSRTAAEESVRSLRDALDRIDAGPKDDALLAQVPSLKQSVAVAGGQYFQSIESVTPTIAALLNSDQTTSWETARANIDLPSRYRYAPGLSDDQKHELEVAFGKRSRIPGIVQAAEYRIFGSIQRNSLETARSNTEARLPGILSAEAAVLPMPPELQEVVP